MAEPLDSDRKSSFANRATMESQNKRAPKGPLFSEASNVSHG